MLVNIASHLEDRIALSELKTLGSIWIDVNFKSRDLKCTFNKNIRSLNIGGM